MGIHPKGKYSLRRSSKLAGARKHATTCNPDWKIESCAILKSNDFRGKLGGAVKRHRSRGAEIYPDSICCQAVRQRCGLINDERLVMCAKWNCNKRRNRVHTTAAK